MKKRPVKPFTAVLTTFALLASAFVFGAPAAFAAAECNQPEAPPVCHRNPPPPPPPTADLESPAFTPIAGVVNRVYVFMNPVPHSAVAPYAPITETPYRVSISCTNGYFYSHTLHALIGDSLAHVVDIPADVAAGSCYVATWDQSVLKLAHVSVARDAYDSTAREDWEVRFTP